MTMVDQVIAPIRLESISKCYRIYKNPQDRFKQALLDRFHVFSGRKEKPDALYREHWALRDISFELKPGEAVGILGRNGAGKSTLLQIIAGTLEPTSGTVATSGRITALLELGSGFNTEFTGRENVFLNAQILGLSREDALNRFDDIASFADIGDFIDQPVKTYSSGMMMRLAFAVQTAVDPKVLIVDEALSVGDMFFQAKCMARIRKLVSEGVTLLFVSHDVGVIRQLCSRAILLKDGEVAMLGDTRKVADTYIKVQLEDRNRSAREQRKSTRTDCGDPAGELSPTLSNQSLVQRQKESLVGRAGQAYSEKEMVDLEFGKELFLSKAVESRTGSCDAEILNVQMLRDGKHSVEFEYDDNVLIRVLVRFKITSANVNLAVKIRTLQGTDVVFMDTRLQGELGKVYEENAMYLFNWSVRLPMMHGNYALSVGLAHPPALPGDDWIFIDVISHVYDFKMGPRREGMIGGFFAPPTQLQIDRVG